MNTLLLFWIILKGSLFSTGGFGNFPSVHSDLIAKRWAVERQFAEALAVGQVSPGPNGFWVISLAYLIDGVPGAAVALLAISLPPFMIIAVDRLFRRVQDHPAVIGFVRGLSLSACTIFTVVLLQLLHRSGGGVRGLVIASIAATAAALRIAPAIAILAAGALAGYFWH